MKYIITKIEKRDFPSGKTKATVTLQDPNGSETEKVDIWKNDLAFDSYAVGTELEGDITVKQNGQYQNRTFNKANTAPSWATKKPSGMVTAVKEKAASIEKAMTRKEDSIAIMSANRDATLLTVEWIKQMGINGSIISDEQWQGKWKSTRKWLLDNNGSDSPFI